MDIIIKNMESADEIRGKAYVHWKSWQEAYPGIVDQRYLDALTLEKCEEIAFRWTENILVAKDGDRVIGFVGYGVSGDGEGECVGEIYAIYVLSEYYGMGVGYRLMQAGLERIREYPKIIVRVLKENSRAIRFYERCGFAADGSEETLELGSPVAVIRMGKTNSIEKMI